MDPEELKQCSYVLLRHGLSMFNLKHLEALKDFGPESDEVKAVFNDPDGWDPELHPVGIA